LSTVMMMRMMMISLATMARHVEGRIAFLKTELKITDVQQPLTAPGLQPGWLVSRALAPG